MTAPGAWLILKAKTKSAAPGRREAEQMHTLKDYLDRKVPFTEELFARGDPVLAPVLCWDWHRVPGPEEIRVRSIPADPNTVEEKKPFISGVKQREDKRFEAKAKKEGKNPLLTPRQGIKEEIRDDE